MYSFLVLRATATPESIGAASQWRVGPAILWALLFGLLAYVLYRRFRGS